MEGGRRTKRQLPILKGLGAQLSLSGRLQEAYKLMFAVLDRSRSVKSLNISESRSGLSAWNEALRVCPKGSTAEHKNSPSST